MTSPAAPTSADALRAAGLRVTDSRRAVLEALTQAPHSSADELYRRVALINPQTNLQSVYNALADFVAAGVARRIEPAGHPGLYERRVADNHHHLVCTSCGAVADVDCVVGEAPCLHPSSAHGFTVHTAEVTFWGLCADCRPLGTTSDTGVPSPVPPTTRR
ncbi:Fur family ferric uptake transcriptional regulator [Microbacterium sp. SLBN-154]|uniref:Fur family transcriptional regulator n=1 Tax=Microbacterium sp. SLBN-154 TaxID=2768458 RepID=UPI001152137E|nr:Fur family transcriptional regulator [Microbacterium sp. SLBN-154]TQK19025.1 Fur family ferric uptake transcriptional regulator [Microbacterium sp. SLBN-154]